MVQPFHRQARRRNSGARHKAQDTSPNPFCHSRKPLAIYQDYRSRSFCLASLTLRLAVTMPYVVQFSAAELPPRSERHQAWRRLAWLR